MSIPEKNYGNSGMAHFAEMNQLFSPYSILQHIRRVVTPKLVPRTYLRCLQATLIMGERDWSQSLCEVLRVPNLSLNSQFWFFEPNIPKNGVSALKQKK